MKRAGLVGLMTCLFCLVAMAKGDTTSRSQCSQERKNLVDSCKRVTQGFSPSAACCQIVRAIHVECVCPNLSPKIANIINVLRTIKQIKGCGRTVPGSVTTPEDE